MSLLYKNPKWMRNSSILLALFINLPKHVGPCRRSLRKNQLPKSSPTARAPRPRHASEFGTITISQRLKLRSFSFAWTTLSFVLKALVASGSTNSLLTKKDLQSRPCGLSNLALTSLVWRSLNLWMSAFNSPRKNASLQLDFLTHFLSPRHLQSGSAKKPKILPCF